MKILLVDLDSKIPNIALMKLSAFHKSKGDEVSIERFNLSGYPNNRKPTEIDAYGFDKVYISVIFDINQFRFDVRGCFDIEKGGTGYDIYKELPEEIDLLDEDYSLYPDNNSSYGFITRGCIRNCSFCFVPKKEGNLYFESSVEDIIKHKKVKFLDNNILAYDKHKEILQKLIDKKIRCQFNQGLDIRLIDEENAKLLSQMNYLGEYIFAFDNIGIKNIIESKLKILKKYISKDWKIKMFIYCHPNMNIKDDLLFRIKWCYNNKVLPYLMRDVSCWDSKHRNFYIDLCAWCNQPSLFKKLSFREFMLKRTKNVERQKESTEIFEQ